MAGAEPLWRAADFAGALGGEVRGGSIGDITGISIDSRTIGRGEAFFAIQGERFDGHDFVQAALASGAACAVVSRARAAAIAGGPLVIVQDVLEGLRDLARAGRARAGARVIAVTGSVGKTGTKEALRAALGASGETHASAASFNNHWGVPLSLARMPRSSRFAIFEAGMNHPGEITPLSAMIRPHIAIVTTVAPVHLGFFKSVDDIAAAKAEIFCGLEPGGTAILNRDNVFFDFLKDRAVAAGAGRIIGFGEHDKADARLLAAALMADMSSVDAVICGQRLAFKIGAPGRHLVLNALAVLAAVQEAGGDLALGAMALAQWRAPRGRGERHMLKAPGGSITLVDESYNANPASMAAAIDTLGRAAPGGRGRRIAVLGDMLELGESSPELHAALCEPLAQAGIDLVYTAGPMMAHLNDALPLHMRAAHAASSDELGPLLLRDVHGGDVVMIKGSLGSRMGPLVELLRAHFAPRREAD